MPFALKILYAVWYAGSFSYTLTPPPLPDHAVSGQKRHLMKPAAMCHPRRSRWRGRRQLGRAVVADDAKNAILELVCSRNACRTKAHRKLRAAQLIEDRDDVLSRRR